MRQGGVEALPPDVRAAIAGYKRDVSQLVILSLPYYSTVRFGAARAAGPPITMTIDTTVRTAFSYGQGQPMTAAGFATGNGTAAETNLIRGSETRDQADVWIWGIACAITPDSEPALARRVVRDTAVAISLNGTQQLPLGTLEHFPGGGGLYGAGVSALKQPDLATPGGSSVENGAGSIMPFFNNGNPMSGNFYRLPQPFKWAGVGSGADSSLGILFTPQRSIVETAGVARVAAAGVSAFTPPAAAGDFGTYVDVRVRLICVSVNVRGVNT
jgi:hypothetical protein